MKKIILMLGMVALACLAAEQKKKDAYDIRPEAKKAADAPAGEAWQRDNAAVLAAAVAPEALAEFVKDETSAAALLSAVKPGYATDPIQAFRIAAVTQYVMIPPEGCPFLRTLAFWNYFRDSPRDIWARQLLVFATKATATEVKIYYLDQLRWCGYANQATQVRALASAAADKALADFAFWVAEELDNSAAVRAGF